MLHGTGANGKSKFLAALSNVFGMYGQTIPFSSLEAMSRHSIPSDIAGLVGKRLVMSSETNETTKLNEGRIKSLTGGDQIAARFLYGNFFTFQPVSKFWLAVNHRPKVSDDTYSFWRRVNLIPFDRTFDQRTADKQLEPVLKAEAPGIFAWAVRGCLEWQRDGLDPPKRVVAVTQKYQQDNDQVYNFLQDQCVRGETFSVRALTLYQAYRRWAGAQGMPKDDVLTNTMFGRRMGERFKKRKTNAGANYIGVGLASDIGSF